MTSSKYIAALAALGAVATGAYAQSSVTLFGVLDASLRSVKTGDASAKVLASDGNMASRFGLRGEEELLTRLKAVFWLEGTVAPDTGKGDSARLFNRRATVALVSNPAGEVRMGRDQLATWNNWAAFDPFSTVGVGTITALIAKQGATVDFKRADNAVSYFLPNTLGGIYGQLQGSLGEGQAGRSDSFRLGWRSGALDMAVAGTNIAAATSSASNVPAGKWKQIHGAAAYDFGVAKLFAQYAEQKRVPQSGAETQQTLWSVAGTVPVGSAGVVKAAYARSGDYAQATLLSLGYQHTLSKRTALYGTLGRIQNKNANANFTVGGDNTVPSVAGPDNRSTGYEVGVRHTF